MLQPELLGPYRIIKRIGRGGMGTVYAAINEQTNEPAAIKVLNPALSDEAGFRDRFAIEIETLKKLRHPNIVRLFGSGEQDEIIYYAMELVDGSNLEDELQNGRRFTWREFLPLAIKLAKALKLAHDHGIVHRDLKPANILISPDEDVKLTDFGIAKLFGSTQLTSDGGLIGTAEYMSPEQAEGKPVNFYSDLYSLGGVFFAMLAGRPPFSGKSLPEVLQMQRFIDPPRVSQYAPDTPQALVDLLYRLLSKTPEDRATNAGMLSKELLAMEHALLARANKIDAEPTEQPLTNSGDYSISQSETLPGDAVVSEIDPNQPTRVAQDLHTLAAGLGRVSTSEERQTRKSLGSLAVPAIPTVKVKAISQNRFLTVEEEESREHARERQQRFQTKLLQIMGIVAVLAMIGVIVYLIVRPPSADELFEQISEMRSTKDKGPKYAEKLEQYTNNFPNTQNSKLIADWREEQKREEFERELTVKSSALIGDETISPVIREFIVADSHVDSDPILALQQFQAIQALFSESLYTSEQERRVFATVKLRIKDLEESAKKMSRERIEWLNKQLEIAESIIFQDRERAINICRGVIALYFDRAWATPQIKRARDNLDKWESISTPLPSPTENIPANVPPQPIPSPVNQ